LKALTEVELGIPLSDQVIVYNGSPLLDDSRSLLSFGVKDNDLILIQSPSEISSRVPPLHSSSSRASHGTSSSTRAPPPRVTSLHDLASIRDPVVLRDTLLANPSLLNQIDPRLAAAASESIEKFRALLIEMETARAMQAIQQQHLMRAAEENPFDTEIQAKIQAEIDQRNVEHNMALAMEYSPEVFAQVHMLYIDVEVNSVKVKAFVDSGAQSSIMSQECAERCGIMRLLDRRFKGVAQGVGTALILGRVHQTQIKMGGRFFTSAFTVMENQKHTNSVEFLLGLDMLKRHQVRYTELM
jgi:DNA damage-inducible protein 1